MSACSVGAASAITTSTTPPAGCAFADFSANYSSQGGLAGSEAGYNWQSGNYHRRCRGRSVLVGHPGQRRLAIRHGAFPGVTAVDADNWRWGGTLRVRGGFTVDRWLMFFTGGYAFGDIQHTNTPPAGSPGRQVQRHGQRSHRGRRLRLCDYQQRQRQVRVSLLQLHGLQPGRQHPHGPHAERTAALHDQ